MGRGYIVGTTRKRKGGLWRKTDRVVNGRNVWVEVAADESAQDPYGVRARTERAQLSLFGAPGVADLGAIKAPRRRVGTGKQQAIDLPRGEIHERILRAEAAAADAAALEVKRSAGRDLTRARKKNKTAAEKLALVERAQATIAAANMTTHPMLVPSVERLGREADKLREAVAAEAAMRDELHRVAEQTRAEMAVKGAKAAREKPAVLEISRKDRLLNVAGEFSLEQRVGGSLYNLQREALAMGTPLTIRRGKRQVYVVLPFFKSHPLRMFQQWNSKIEYAWERPYDEHLAAQVFSLLSKKAQKAHEKAAKAGRSAPSVQRLETERQEKGEREKAARVRKEKLFDVADRFSSSAGARPHATALYALQRTALKYGKALAISDRTYVVLPYAEDTPLFLFVQEGGKIVHAAEKTYHADMAADVLAMFSPKERAEYKKTVATKQFTREATQEAWAAVQREQAVEIAVQDKRRRERQEAKDDRPATERQLQYAGDLIAEMTRLGAWFDSDYGQGGGSLSAADLVGMSSREVSEIITDLRQELGKSYDPLSKSDDACWSQLLEQHPTGAAHVLEKSERPPVEPVKPREPPTDTTLAALIKQDYEDPQTPARW